MARAYFYHRWNAKRHGRRDAGFGFPAPGEPPSGYLGEVQHVAETHLQQEAKACEKTLGKFDKRIATGISRTDLENKKLGEVEETWKERGKKPIFAPWFHYLILGLVIAGEFVINELALRSYEDNPLLNALMTLSIGAIIITMSHYVGRTLKKPGRDATDKSLMVAAIVVAIAVSFAIAGSRAKYIAEKDIGHVPVPARSVLAETQKVSSETNEDERSRGLWMFLAFQAGAFLAGMLTAFASSDPVEEQRRRSNKASNKERHAYTDRERAWQRSGEKAASWCSIADHLQAAYVGENTKHRTDGVKPRDLVAIAPKMPEIFLTYPEPPLRPTETPVVSISLNGKASRAATKRIRASNHAEAER